MSFLPYYFGMASINGMNNQQWRRFNMDYEQLHSAVTKLLAKTQKEMEKLIEEYNENNDAEIDTVDLDSKFDPVFDYVEDYINE